MFAPHDARLDEKEGQTMILATLPLIWGLAGIVAVVLLSDHRASRTEDTPRVDMTRGDELRPAA